MNNKNPLLEYFLTNKSNAVDKWFHYFDIYHKYFNKFRGKPIVILEVGVFQGGSLLMWQNYFSNLAQIYAIDILPECKKFESENIKIFIGSQDDRNFLRNLKKQIPKIDILIDDGGHTMNQQIVAFEELYDHVKDNGIYLIEDLHTSYWKSYGGGYKNPKSFIEYSKDFIDLLNAWHSKDDALNVNEFTKSTYSLHYYDSILVVEKQKRTPPVSKMTGEIMIDISRFKTIRSNISTTKDGFYQKLDRRIKKVINLIKN